MSTTIVSGECADDPLYVPEIRKVQASLGQHGVLYVGDCKRAALASVPLLRHTVIIICARYRRYKCRQQRYGHCWLLGLTPLHLTSTTRIKGLIRLLSIGLRVLCLVEFTVREALQEQGQKRDGIYAGNPKRATVRPTTEMMLRAFIGICLVTVNFDGIDWRSVSPLNAVQSRIFALLGFPVVIYQTLAGQSGERAGKMGEP